MRLTKIRLRRAGRPNWLLPFFAGLMLGVMLVHLNQNVFGIVQDNSGIDIAFYQKIENLNPTMFFFCLIRKRIGLLWMMLLLSTSVFGLAVMYFFMLWCGIGTGMLFSVFFVKYGGTGILILLAGMFPQMIFYIPACFLLLECCVGIFEKSNHFTCDYTEDYVKKGRKIQIVGQLLLLHGVVIIGIVLESYVNPNIMTELLKKF